MKTNFRTEKKTSEMTVSEFMIQGKSVPDKQLTPKEFEDWVLKSGAKGSFMVYRSENENEELGIDEL